MLDRHLLMIGIFLAKTYGKRESSNNPDKPGNRS